MTVFQRAIVSVVALAAAAAVYMLRFEVVPLPGKDGPVAAYVLDRWTGRVVLLSGITQYEIEAAAKGAR